ncbi:MAG: hypothetical protein ABT940_12730 [Alphaproteobacteria bacterium]
MNDITIPDLDRYVSRDRAAQLLNVTPIYVAQLCRQGHLTATLTTRQRGRGHPGCGWTNIDLYSILLYSILRAAGPFHGRCATPDQVLAGVQSLRCPQCGILVDTPGPCAHCAAGRPNYWSAL